MHPERLIMDINIVYNYISDHFYFAYKAVQSILIFWVKVDCVHNFQVCRLVFIKCVDKSKSVTEHCASFGTNFFNKWLKEFDKKNSKDVIFT